MKDYLGYKGKDVVITGAASGMGKAATEMLVDLGANVYALDYAEVKVPGITKFIQVNLADKASIDNAFKQIPDEFDSFFGVAGVSGLKHDFLTTFNIDFTSNVYMVETYLEKRLKSGGAMAFVTSESGLRWEVPGHKEEYMMAIDAAGKGWEGIQEAIKIYKDVPKGPTSYALAKRAMHMYIATIVDRFGLRKIRVNAILPAATDTGLTDEFAINVGGRETLEKYTGTAQRLAKPEEMGQPLVFLCSDMATYISGALLKVDHGMDLPAVAGISPDLYDYKLVSE